MGGGEEASESQRTPLLWDGKRNSLRVGQLVYAKDVRGVWYDAAVIEMSTTSSFSPAKGKRDVGEEVRVHFKGWSVAFDEWTKLRNIKPLGLTYWRHNLKRDCLIEAKVTAGCKSQGTARPTNVDVVGPPLWHKAIVESVDKNHILVRYSKSSVTRSVDIHSEDICERNTHIVSSGETTETDREFAGRPRRRRPNGLKNPQNYCYINATVQILTTLCLTGEDKCKRTHFEKKKEQKIEENLSSAASRSPTSRPERGTAVVRTFVQMLQKMGFESSELLAAKRNVILADGINSGTVGYSSKALSTAPLKTALSNRYDQFRGTDQQDAHEFLQCLLNALHSTQSTVSRAPNVDEAALSLSQEDIECPDSYWSQYVKTSGHSPVIDRCTGLLCNELRCPSCEARHRTFDPFVALPVPLAPPTPSSSTVSLEDCLHKILASTETLDRDDSWRCGACKNLVQATKRTTLCKLPKYLFLCLKRFRHGDNEDGRIREKKTSVDTASKDPHAKKRRRLSSRRPKSRKLTYLVDFPLVDMSVASFVSESAMSYVAVPATTPKTDIEPDADTTEEQTHLQYDLCGVIDHTGTMNRGHYTSSVRFDDGEWYTCDDEKVSSIPEEKVATPNALGAKIVFGLEHLRRYFANVEKEISTHPPPKPSLSEVIDRNENGSNTSSVAIKTIARRDAKAQTDRAPKYVVRGSKKGALPLVLEKRRHGKVVSVIRNVEGDAKSLLVELKHYLGTGGTVVPMRETSVKPRDHSRMLKSRSTKHRRSTEESPRYMQVEIQGNHMKRIGAYLSKKGGLSGVNRHAKAAAEALASKKKSDKAKKSDKKVIVAGRRVDASNAASKKLPDLSKPLDTKAVKKMNPTTLKLVLKARGLSTQGTKKELIKRVLEGSAGP
eukprot:g92.t1